MKYKLVIFDFDGTIADTSEGIIDAHRYTLSYMGRNVPTNEVLKNIIGGQLLKTYMNSFDFSEKEARKAIKVYRERYAKVGIHKATLYPSFEQMISTLRKKGYKLGVATLKAERFAKEMLKEMGIQQYFDGICGMDEGDELNKAGLIKKCCSLCNVKECETILVGDSNNDIKGAKEAGIAFLGVTYGFGLKREIEYEFDTVDKVENIIQFFA